MPRAKKNVHGSPEHCGEANMPDEYIAKKKDDLDTLDKLIGAYHIGLKNRQDYKGQYNEEQLRKAVNEFFDYCAEKSAKPTKFGLQTWLGISRQTYNEWQSKPEKYGFKTDVLQMANDFMAWTYESRLEQYPTGNIFLLKARHDVVETNRVEITNTGNVNQDDISDALSKLGLDKTEE